MKKLEKPKMSVREILTDISNITRDKNKKSQICDSIDLIKEYSDKYDDKRIIIYIPLFHTIK